MYLTHNPHKGGGGEHSDVIGNILTSLLPWGACSVLVRHNHLRWGLNLDPTLSKNMLTYA